MGSLFRRLIPAAGLALSLTACGFAVEGAATEGGDVVEDTTSDGGAAGMCPEGTPDCIDADLGGGAGGGAAGGTCLEGTEDCVDADLGGDAGEEPALGGDFDLAVARRDAESLLAATEEQLQSWGDVRIERKGDEEFMLTMDLVPGRKTVELDADADGVYRVTTVTLELPEGDTEVFTR